MAKHQYDHTYGEACTVLKIRIEVFGGTVASRWLQVLKLLGKICKTTLRCRNPNKIVFPNLPGVTIKKNSGGGGGPCTCGKDDCDCTQGTCSK